MKFRGKIKSVFRDVVHNSFVLQIDSEDGNVNYNPETLYEFKFDKYYENKSDSQRRYYWKLVTMISESLKPRRSTAWVHNDLLRRYGQLVEYDGDHIPVVIDVSKSEMIDEDMKNHFKPTSDLREGKDGKMYRTYLLLKGSSSYDVREMMQLIDGAIDQAKELDLQVDTPDEIARLKSVWGE